MKRHVFEMFRVVMLSSLMVPMVSCFYTSFSVNMRHLFPFFLFKLRP